MCVSVYVLIRVCISSMHARARLFSYILFLSLFLSHLRPHQPKLNILRPFFGFGFGFGFGTEEAGSASSGRGASFNPAKTWSFSSDMSYALELP